MLKIQLATILLLASVAVSSPFDPLFGKESRQKFRDSIVSSIDKVLLPEDNDEPVRIPDRRSVPSGEDQVEGFISCEICQTTVGYVDQILNEQKTLDLLEGIASTICADFVEKHNVTVCPTATHMMGQFVVPSLTRFLLAPEYLCSPRALAYCDAPVYEELPAKDFVDQQMKDKPESLKSNDFIDGLYDKIKADPSERETLKVIHMSDIHMDFKYTPGTIAACTLPVCCNVENGYSSDPLISAGKWGDYRNCDLPPESYTIMLNYIKEELKPDMFVWTGDNSAHKVWKNTEEEVINYTEYETNKWNEVFNETDVSMFPVMGNHDTWPVNVMDFSSKGDNKAVVDYAALWKDFFTSAEAHQSFADWGYYSMPFTLKSGRKFENTKVIGINCQGSNDMNWFLPSILNDPGMQIDFLEHELSQLQKVGGSAIVLSHFPPTSYLYSFGQRFYSLMDRYQDVVRFTMVGHTHNEGFQVTRSIVDSKAIGWTYRTGSMTTYGGKNPGFTLVELDAEYLVPVKMDTYFYNVTRANLEDKVTFEHFHSFNQDYKLEDLRPSNILDLSHRFIDDEQLAIDYDFFAPKGGKSRDEYSCDKDCRYSKYCDTAHGDPDGSTLCNGGTPSHDGLYETLDDPWLKVVSSD
jgi:sphingomyelin phosphodiesterase